MARFWQYLVSISTLFTSSFLINLNTDAFAQSITLDGSLGTPGTLTGPDYVIPQAAGQAVGNNLFHSFGQFNLNSNEAAIFQSNPNIQNILSRVTGGNQSVIDGLIRTQSGVNLFLINPSGIIFGQNARLDVGGSFVASTANALQFGNLGFFSATDKNVPSPLLTINPSAFLFNQIKAASIINNSIASAGQTPAGSPLTGLRVPDGQSLRFVGGDVDSSGGDLVALSGQVEISGNNLAVKNIATAGYFGNPGGAITLNAKNNINITGDLNSFAFARVDNAGNGGAITLKATDNINITGDLNSWAFTNVGNTGNGGAIALTAERGDINIKGTLDSSALSNTGNPGNAGSITLNAPTGSIKMTGDLNAYSYSDKYSQFFRAGNGGKITLNAANGININGNIAANSYANFGSSGDGGDILVNISAGSLKMRGDLDASSTGNLGSLSGISISDASVGNGGRVSISAGDRIDIASNYNFSPTISTQAWLTSGSPYDEFIQTGNIGNAGTITLTAPNGIKVTGSIDSSIYNDNDNDPNSNIDSKSNAISGNGGAVNLITSNGNIEIGSIRSNIFARFGNIGNGGNVNLNAPQGNIQVNGIFGIDSFSEVSFGNSSSGGAITLTALGDITVPYGFNSHSSAAAGNAANGGDIALTTVNGNTNLGGVNSYSLVNYVGNSGNAGTVTLTAPNGKIQTKDVFAFSVSTQSPLNPDGLSGKGGTIAVTAKNDITTGSLISYGGTESGNITVTTNGAFATANSIISTSTNGAGKSGNIEIRAQSVSLSEGTQVSTSTATQGKGGNLTIIAPEFVTLGGSSSEIVRFAYTQQGLFAAPGSGLPSGVKLSGYIPPLAFSRQFGDVNFPTGLFTQTSGQIPNAGNGGVITIQTGKLTIQDQGVIAATTFGTGKGGNIFVQANDIEMKNGSILTGVGPETTGNSGNIDIQTRSLSLNKGGVVQSLTLGAGNAGNIRVQASDAVTIAGVSPNSSSLSGLLSGTEGIDSGRGGNINVTTPQLRIFDKATLSARTLNSSRGGDIVINANTVEATGGGQMLTNTSSSGKAGDIAISATQEVKLSDLNSGLFARTQGAGVGGQVKIDTPLLKVINAGRISVATASQETSGVGGSVSVNAAQIIMTGDSNISAGTEGAAKGGNLTLQAYGNGDNLTVNFQDGAEISASTSSSGQGGNVLIKAPNSVTLQGNGAVSAGAISNGKGGNLTIETEKLTIKDSARATVSAPQGQAGNLTVTAKKINLNNGNITAETAITNGEEGANIKLQGLKLLLMQNGSRISAQARGTATGGNINIDADRGFVVAYPREDNDIIASAAFGRGGNIIITAERIFGLTEGKAILGNGTNDIDASSDFNSPGKVTLKTPDLDPSGGLTELPTNLVDVSQQIAQGCTPKGKTASHFISTGRGGLPLNPDEPLRGRAVITNWVTLDEGNQEIKAEITPQPTPQTIVEAQGWVINADGKVQLVASVPGGGGAIQSNSSCGVVTSP
ncbi:S-layer family protein [Calothrix sp. PCC 7507]|uniref:beta strand repeat-containing protein n=1 Tax=Calothrix sp. PCC 7507 TaxID=99598 RepID=UPI00029F3F34|nr:filamentous hemagglutinin N-terminal domain-containing protein [Calothrix sp. PCC 7507]AFY34516.1 filamentous hemagglutinin family outer membrane protein [Calothrix sp. PCC 7507]